MLACARIGAPHSVVFGGFSAEALGERINDAEAKALTQDGGYRRGALVPLKANADEALLGCPTIEHVVTVKRAGNDHSFTAGRDHWYHEVVRAQPTECPPEEMGAEDPLYILYTSGTTGKPKGIVHTTGGYLTGVTATHRLIFDIHDDVFWCAADIGWVTGHSYIVCPNVYLAGDGAKRDDDGYFWLLGRIDDVMNIAGHHLSTYEIEKRARGQPQGAEAAVVSRPDEAVGQAIVAFVTLKSGFQGDERAPTPRSWGRSTRWSRPAPKSNQPANRETERAPAVPRRAPPPASAGA